MAYKNPDAPASDKQVKWVHGLWKTARERGLQDQVLSEAYTKLPKLPRFALGPLLDFGQASSGTYGHTYTMEEVGTIIGVMLDLMPDKKPKQKARPSNTSNTSHTQVPAPVGQPDIPDHAPPQGPTADEIVRAAVTEGQAVMVIVVPLTTPPDQTQVQAVTELVGLFLKAKTTLPVDGDLQVHWTAAEDTGLVNTKGAQ